MTREQYYEGRYRNTIETIKRQEDSLKALKTNHQKKSTLDYIEHLKNNLKLMDSGEFWNEITEYYYSLLYKNAAYDYKIIAVI